MITRPCGPDHSARSVASGLWRRTSVLASTPTRVTRTAVPARPATVTRGAGCHSMSRANRLTLQLRPAAPRLRWSRPATQHPVLRTPASSQSTRVGPERPQDRRFVHAPELRHRDRADEDQRPAQQDQGADDGYRVVTFERIPPIVSSTSRRSMTDTFGKRAAMPACNRARSAGARADHRRDVGVRAPSKVPGRNTNMKPPNRTSRHSNRTNARDPRADGSAEHVRSVQHRRRQSGSARAGFLNRHLRLAGASASPPRHGDQSLVGRQPLAYVTVYSRASDRAPSRPGTVPGSARVR